MFITEVAKICHEANRAYCASLGDFSQTSWDEAPDWQRTSAVKGVEFHLNNPQASASASHESWLKEKQQDGWSMVRSRTRRRRNIRVTFRSTFYQRSNRLRTTSSGVSSTP